MKDFSRITAIYLYLRCLSTRNREKRYGGGTLEYYHAEKSKVSEARTHAIQQFRELFPEMSIARLSS